MSVSNDWLVGSADIYALYLAWVNQEEASLVQAAFNLTIVAQNYDLCWEQIKREGGGWKFNRLHLCHNLAKANGDAAQACRNECCFNTNFVACVTDDYLVRARTLRNHCKAAIEGLA